MKTNNYFNPQYCDYEDRTYCSDIAADDVDGGEEEEQLKNDEDDSNVSSDLSADVNE